MKAVYLIAVVIVMCLTGGAIFFSNFSLFPVEKVKLAKIVHRTNGSTLEVFYLAGNATDPYLIQMIYSDSIKNVHSIYNIKHYNHINYIAFKNDSIVSLSIDDTTLRYPPLDTFLRLKNK